MVQLERALQDAAQGGRGPDLEGLLVYRVNKVRPAEPHCLAQHVCQ
jgi:hypothetical protein